MADLDIDDIGRRMNGALGVLQTEFSGLRTGRASVGLLEPIMVDAYDSKMPLNQVGSIGAPDARMLTVQVWDQGLTGAVERAIRESDLGLNPSTEGNLIRVPIPQLSEERREELVKVAHKYAEQSRVAVRNVRRDGMEKLKRMEKASEISQDEQRAWGEDMQKMTDDIIKSIDEALDSKEKEVMQV